MSRIAEWLASLGMSEYAGRFAENRIDFSVLRDLTDQDLKDLGVVLGDRRKMLRAIGELAGVVSAIPEPRTATEPRPQDAAERRQLTVMFCDLVGSTALSARLDPEDMREIIGTYHRCFARHITNAGGFVAKYMGDGVLAYFGYPEAHEDDAERATRAALALAEAVPKLQVSHGAVLQVRIGVATGLVVVGDLIGEGEAQERGVVGDTPNLAARLQALAEPGQVVISQSTRRLAGGLFEYRDLGKVALKGLAEPLQAWQVTGTSAVQSRFEAQHEATLTPLVGREEELELLLRRWRQAATGEGRVVLISGEPGIGKSRLIAALEERLQGEPHTRLRYFCSPQHTDSAFYPVIMQLERAAGFERHGTAEAKFDKLLSLLGAPSGHNNDVQLLAELLSIPTSDRYAPLNWSPQRKKEKTFGALLGQLEVLSRQRPVLVTYEDVHWIDPSSRELLDMAVERVAALRVLLLVTFRPEFEAPWTGQAHVAALGLTRLVKREGAALAGLVARDSALPDEIMAEIVERADGIPLFVEELTKAMLETGAHDQDGTRTVTTAQFPALAVPATLHASLMARLDRLGPVAKEIAQIGAAIGREFPYELLVPVAQKSDAELQGALGRLSDAGLVFCRGTPPQATFIFKHALVRDAAYVSLLRSQRQQLHAGIAEAFELHRDHAETRPEILAHHLAEAGFAGRAISYLRKAARRSAEHWANAEAVRHLNRARELTTRLGDEAARRETELGVLLELGPVLLTVRGFAAPEVEEIYRRASGLCVDGADPTQRFAANWGLWNAVHHHNRFEAARRLADELIALAIASEDRALLLQAHHSAWTTAFVMGDDRSALQHSEEGIRLYNVNEHRGHAARYGGHDPGVCARMMGGMAAWFLGYPERARTLSAASVELGRTLGDPFTWAMALSVGASIAMLQREPAGVEERVTALQRLRDAHQMALGHFGSTAKMLHGWAVAASGRPGEGVKLTEQGLSETRRIGFARISFQLGVMADVYRLAGSASAARDAVEEALRVGEAQGEARWHPYILEKKGWLLAAAGEVDSATTAYLAALDTARRLGARALELRASTSLARLWRDQGKRTEARDLLAPIYGWFTEGFDTPDLKEAKALLGELE